MKVKYLIIGIILFVLGTIAYSYFYEKKNYFNPLFEEVVEVHNLSMRVYVAGRVGVNVENKSLEFGVVPRAASSTRSINLTNYKNFTLKVVFKATGNIAPWVSYPRYVILQPNEMKKINIVVKVPMNAKFGMYNGTFYIYVIKRRFS